MKIIKGVGERLLPRSIRPILVFTGAGCALLEGSHILILRMWRCLSRRLEGWERFGAVAFAGHLVVYSCTHAPAVARFAIPAAAVAWCVAAWWAAPPALAPETAEETPTEPAPHGFTRWLLDTIGDRPGIHLRELYPAMRQLPGCEGHDNAQLRAALDTLGIPVHRSLRLGHVAGRSGVRRTDLLTLPSPDVQDRAETGGDAGQRVDSPPLSTVGEES